MKISLCLSLCLSLTLLACQKDASLKQDAPVATSTATSVVDEPAPAASQPAAASAPVKAPTYQQIPRPGGDESTSDLDALVRGKPMDELVKLYGPPHKTYEVKMDEGVPEFRIELYNDYPPGEPQSKGIIITEHTYRYDEDGYQATIWYHDVAGTMTALQAVSWNDGVKF